MKTDDKNRRDFSQAKYARNREGPTIESVF